jgi:hypothetical protein
LAAKRSIGRLPQLVAGLVPADRELFAASIVSLDPFEPVEAAL